MKRRNNNPSMTMAEDQESAGVQRPPPPEEEPHRYLCLVVAFPGVILLGIAVALTIFLVALKNNNNKDNDGPVKTFAPSPTDPLWFDISENRDNDDLSLSFPTRRPTQNPTPRTSSSLINNNDDDYFPTTPWPTKSPQTNPPTLAPSPLPTNRPSLAPSPLPTNRPSLALLPSAPTFTLVPTTFPTTEEIFLENTRNRFREILESRSPSSFAFDENNDNSPQAKAQNWLIRDPQFYSYSEDRLLQRWVLATFAFGMVAATDDDDNPNNAIKSQQEQQLSVPQAMQNWVQYTDECTRWFYTLGDGGGGGTELCNSDGLYTRLDLRTQNLEGTLPSEIALLSNHLRYIHLYDNRIYGSLPSEMGLLSNLARFELTKNNMEGELPTELGNLGKLKFLGLGRNSFSGPVPSEIGKLRALNTIGLEWNNFSKIPIELGNMTNTRILNLDHNNISGTFPETYGQLLNLEKMNLIFNAGLVGTIPDALCELDMDSLRADCGVLNCSCCTRCHYYL